MMRTAALATCLTLTFFIGQDIRFTLLAGSAIDSPSAPGSTRTPPIYATAPMCTVNCEVVLREAVMIAEASELPDYAQFVRTRSGEWVTTSRRRDRVLVFSSQGKLHKTLDSQVEGRDSFRKADYPLVTPNDSLMVYDYQSGRATVFGAGYRAERSIELPGPPTVVLSDNTIVVAQQIPTQELVGYPIHLLDGGGRHIRSFGAETPQYRSDLKWVTDRIVAPAQRNELWAAAKGRYSIERWNVASGTALSKITVRSAWFRESNAYIDDERTRPNPSLEALWETDQILWVLLRDADSHWRAPVNANVERPFRLAEYNQRFDWVLEAINPSTGEVVASRRLDSAHFTRSGTGVLAAPELGKEVKQRRIRLYTAELRKKEL